MSPLRLPRKKEWKPKTHIAVQMAAGIVRRKLKTATIDTYPQGSAIQWNKSRPPERKLDATDADATSLLPC